MDAVLPTVSAVEEIESRQDEVLRMLDELEQRVLKALKEFGEPLRNATLPMPIPNADKPKGSVSKRKAA